MPTAVLVLWILTESGEPISGLPMTGISIWGPVFKCTAQISVYHYNDIEKRKSRSFYSLLTALQTVFNTYVQVARVQLCAS